MTKCFICGLELPEKDLTDVLESMEKYRERFPDDWDEEPPVLICIKCDEERQDEC